MKKSNELRKIEIVHVILTDDGRFVELTRPQKETLFQAQHVGILI